MIYPASSVHRGESRGPIKAWKKRTEQIVQRAGACFVLQAGNPGWILRYPIGSSRRSLSAFPKE